jgi:succinylglutamate desuccinylase
MVSTHDPEAIMEAKTFIQADLNRIVGNFGKSLRKGNAAVEILMMGTRQEYQHTKVSKREKELLRA